MLQRKSAIAANRFGLGARPGDAARIGADAGSWLRSQLGPAAATAVDATPSSGPASAATPSSRPASAATLEEIAALRLARQAAQSRLRNQPPEVDEASVREYARFVAERYRQQAAASLMAAVGSDQPFRERLVRFWSNHFAISADKQPLGAIAADYTDEAIRPHVTGRFADLLKAAVQHPAMLLYLDNQTSIGPGSALARLANRNRQLGLNENLAREILELHTLGVDGGYTQNDVIELAKSLTGWSIGGRGGALGDGRLAAVIARRFASAADAGRPGEFVFRDALHEPGAKTILGRRFAEGGADEAEAVLEFLARRPETARFLATKLARHFVADEPPPRLVDRLAAVYTETDGDLVAVCLALVDAPESWQAPLAKYKTHEEFAISAWRALGSTAPRIAFDSTAPGFAPERPAPSTAPSTAPTPAPTPAPSPAPRAAAVARGVAATGIRLVGIATQLGQRPLTPGSPAGWPDTAEHWNGGDALLKRIELATTIGGAVGDRIDAAARLDEVLGETASDATRSGIRRAESGSQAMALLLAAPEFQRR